MIDRLRERWIARYGMVLVTVAAAAWFRHLLTPLWGNNRAFATFYVAVVMSAWFGGLWPGVAATLLSATAAAALWLEPSDSLLVQNPADQVSMLIFILVNLIITLAVAILQRGRLELKAANRVLQAELAARRNWEEAVRESEVRLRLVAEATHDGIWDWDMLTNSVFWSDRLYELLGVPPGTRPQGIDTLTELVHPDDRARFSHAVGELLEHDQPYELELRLRRGDGSYARFHGHARALRGQSGRPIRMAGSFTAVEGAPLEKPPGA